MQKRVGAFLLKFSEMGFLRRPHFHSDADSCFLDLRFSRAPLPSFTVLPFPPFPPLLCLAVMPVDIRSFVEIRCP